MKLRIKSTHIVCFPVYCWKVVMGSMCNHEFLILFGNKIYFWSACLPMKITDVYETSL